MLTGFELFAVKSLAGLEPIFPLNQSVSAGDIIPVRFIHGGNAVVGGTSDGKMHFWDVFSRRKQSFSLQGILLLYILRTEAEGSRKYARTRNRGRGLSTIWSLLLYLTSE